MTDIDRSILTRREFIAASSAVAAGTLFGLPHITRAEIGHEHAWDWLTGNWDVWHRRLKDRLVGSNEWEEFGGKSALWLALGGLGTIDDNIMDLPGGTYRGLTVRAFDPTTQNWSIWWVDGRNPTHIDPPVIGRFAGNQGTFVGRDTFKGIPILMRFRWNDTDSPRPWWEQAFSTDEGKSWEVNWRNYFTRTSPEASTLPLAQDAPGDWGFLTGHWKVRHRRLRKRLVGSNDWQQFEGTCVNWPVLGGHANVDDNVMNIPGGRVRGVGLCTFDPASREWLSWWLDDRKPNDFGTPLRGRFENKIATFIGEEQSDGRTVKTRVQWFTDNPHAPRWEQSSSADGGQTWERNWISEFERARRAQGSSASARL